MTKPNPYRRSVSFTIAYAQMCQWVNNPIIQQRPDRETLEQARNQAERIGDQYILEYIEELEEANFRRATLPTPKLPPSGSVDSEAASNTKIYKRVDTRPFGFVAKIRDSVILPPPPSIYEEEFREIESLLDNFLREVD